MALSGGKVEGESDRKRANMDVNQPPLFPVAEGAAVTAARWFENLDIQNNF